MKTRCPKCDESVEIDPSWVGRHGRCAACGEKFLIEAAESSPSATARTGAAPSSGRKSPAAGTLWGAVVACGALILVVAWLIQNRHPRPEPSEATAESSTTVAQPGGVDFAATADGGTTVAPVVNPGPAPLTVTFPVIREFEQVDIRAYREKYPDVHMGWMPQAADQAEEAKRWGHWLGPIGVRVRSHVPQWQGRPAFAALVPKVIQSQTGELALAAAEVVSVAEGSPADGHLREGDLIVGIDGEFLKSGNAYRPDWDFMHKDRRELQLMLGEKLDEAQARGDLWLTVMRVPQGREEPLPVATRELWRGEGGNQSVGVQEFDIAVPEGGVITLESHQFDDNIHGDGAMWMDVVLVGEDGERSLLEQPSIGMQAGYGSPSLSLDEPREVHGRSCAQSLNLHATGQARWELPDGTKRIKGAFAALSYGKVQPRILHTNAALPLKGIHEESLVELRFPIGRTGSFAEHFPRDCAKTALTVERQVDWLAAQQRDDGSWPRLAGYTRDGWDTSWCALALMSSGDPKFDEAVRKAAYRVAYHDAPSEWTAERTMRLIFLSEYYLKTRDPQILAGIQAAYHQVLDVCKNDFMAGHKVNGFGYGIAGQHYGTGHLALGLALASRTPIAMDRRTLDGVIRHAGEVCVNGTYAYGRGRRMARDDSRRHGGGHAMSGPGLLAVQIGGGHATAVQEFVERMEASMGDGDNSHATSSLAFIFGSLALAAADEEVFLEHMRHFRYKLTLDDNWEGGFLKSAFPLDFQGGEGVTSVWIRSAGTILTLNALKKNLAITGKRELWNPDRLEGTAVSEWGGQVHSYYLRNWCLVLELLGDQAPAALAAGIRELHALPRDMELVPATRRIIGSGAPAMIREIAGNRNLDDRRRAYAIELLCGLDFKIYTALKEGRQQVDLHVALPLQQLNWLDADKAAMFRNSPLPLVSKVTIEGANLHEAVVFETKGSEGFDLDQGVRKFGVTHALKDPSLTGFEGVAKIAFDLGETSVSYERLLRFNFEFAHSNHVNLRRLQLRLRFAPRPFFQTQPLMIAGIPFDCMYPAERMMEIQGPGEGVDVVAHEGDAVLVDLASENFICPWVHALKIESPTQVEILKAREHRMIIGTHAGEWEAFHDFSNATQARIGAVDSRAVVEFDFGSDVTANGLDASFPGTQFMRIWYHDGAAWIPVVWDNYSVGTGHHPVFPDITAQRWRVEFAHGGELPVATLRFYHNPNTRMVRDAHPQMKDPAALPPIEPGPDA
ncbi:DUF6288 domain-containing protein [Haloferula sp. A504]|uniref:DUF6288 domain-containing protein n=1 Tax=Haloferula sp. A504 TaxID=3373601 RepID=UPI0031C0DE96|nr:DUF6288 domain-containing protein [Verrucomicrobiaceae bacterium E54]